MFPARLGVNVDHVATLRQARRTPYPDPVAAALLAEMAGADQITIHLREDRRHTQEMVKIAYDVRPNECTLVPERREELTTEGGLDVVSGRDVVRKVVKTLRDAEIQTSLFIDADLDQVKAAHRVEAEVVEIHTGRYCEARLASDRRRELARIVDAAKAATKLGLKVAAGHGINYQNVLPLAAISEIEEFNIGHAIVARALLVGMERAVREMKELIAQGVNG
jgi:pyridoxine 5-phosphate synthase